VAVPEREERGDFVERRWRVVEGEVVADVDFRWEEHESLGERDS